MSEFSDCKGTTDSFPDYIPSQLSKDKRMEGREIKGKNSREHVTGHALPQSSVPDSPEMDTDGAMIESSEKDMETVCSHFKTVWGLRLDLLLLAIVAVIAAVILKLPLDARPIVTENPPIQQLSDLVDQLNAVKIILVNLEKAVKENSGKHRTQASKLDEIETKINDILNPSNSNEMSYPEIKIKVGQIKESITESHTDAAEKYHTALKDSMEYIQRYLSTSITKHEEINSNLTTNISNIREDVIANISVRFGLVESAAKRLQTDYQITDSKVKYIERVLNEADVQEILKNAEHAKETADKANVKLKTVEQHLFNKDALTAAILILLFLIIGLMLYVLKLKSSLEPSLAGGSTSLPLKESREMKVILQKIPSNPTLDNAVCIVSFDASKSDEYKRMIKETVGQLGKVSFRTHVIRKHADIAELPYCKLFIMCVEFTGRHVIIEEQSLGLGDLKLTSYRGVRKLGGALVILYIHDPGSWNLTDDQLYSDGVYCVKKQQELMELCEIDRFITAHKNLNTAQKRALETAITYELNLQAAM